MASQTMLLIAAAAIAVAFLPVPTSAVDYMVGDDAGWTLKYLATWTDGKTFKVGDNLVFKYPAGKHTVIEVGGADFKSCNLQGDQLNSWNSSSDTVALDKVGRRWFICTLGDHCTQSMKLLVNVVDGSAPGPAAPAPSSLASSVCGATVQAMAAAGVVAATVLLF